MRRTIAQLIAGSTMSVLTFAAQAQNFPVKALRFIAPFPAAGSSDLIARILTPRMNELLWERRRISAASCCA